MSSTRGSGGISVVITTFDDGQFLEQCLASVSQQTLAAAEVLVVDDGTSSPAALAGLDRALDRFPETRIVRQPNSGPPAARNRGLAESRGDFIVFVDADDRLRPDNLAVKRALFDRAADVAATYGGYCSVRPDGQAIPSRFRGYLGKLEPALVGKPNGVPGGLPLYMFRRDALTAIGGLDEGLRIMDDIDAIIRLGREGGAFVGCNEPIYIRNMRSNSLSRASAARTVRGRLRFLAKARREGYFSGPELANRYLNALARSVPRRNR